MNYVLLKSRNLFNWW